MPYIVAEPLPSNLLEWHYVVRGPEDSFYKGGLYHGKLVFPSEFPFKPPSIYMTTPNGRFKTDTRLCLSISDYHPDTWNPAWSVSTILTGKSTRIGVCRFEGAKSLLGLLSFMLERSPTLGSIETSDWDKKQFAYRLKDYFILNPFENMVSRSLEFNLKSRVFCDLFPDLKTECEKEIERRKILAENQTNDPQV